MVVGEEFSPPLKLCDRPLSCEFLAFSCFVSLSPYCLRHRSTFKNISLTGTS